MCMEGIWVPYIFQCNDRWQQSLALTTGTVCIKCTHLVIHMLADILAANASYTSASLMMTTEIALLTLLWLLDTTISKIVDRISHLYPPLGETSSRHSRMEKSQCRIQLNTLQWRHNGRDGVSNHQPQHCLLNLLFRRRSKVTSKLRDTGLSAGNSPVTGEFPAQMASNAENVSIWWCHHYIRITCTSTTL